MTSQTVSMRGSIRKLWGGEVLSHTSDASPVLVLVAIGRKVGCGAWHLQQDFGSHSCDELWDYLVCFWLLGTKSWIGKGDVS